ncbi:sulfatase [uncultured Paludibaculum sp.]|uniref:sulfatase family protein n=1 Tax=uncultured Paludibaculum sp. TaxID=1765020 RepID=UPI002AAAFBE9|nr:sulfatase [uncultured Paludibaculum sp.]
MLDRRGFLTSVATALQPRSARRPNLLFIVADEWRGQALPSAGDPNLIAPNLARLAAESVDFRRAYTSYPVCCPARGAMLTGKFPHAAGVPGNHMRLPLTERTISAELKQAGYRTGYIGKWHLDGHESPGFVPVERRRGFDYWAAYNLLHQHYGAVYFRDTPAPIRIDGFEADGQTNLAIEFLRQKSAQPFFLYLSWVAPHSPFTPPRGHATYDPAKLRLRANVPENSRDQASRAAAGYYGLCSAVDENLGRLLAELDRQGMTEDTIVLFTSDHGITLGSHGLDEIDRPCEETVNIPLMIRYPRRLKKRMERDALVSNVDYAPTLLSLCEVQPPAEMQGVDLSGWLTSGRGAPRTPVYAEGQVGSHSEWRMVVHGRDKLVVDCNLRPTHLYHLGHDPYELKNLVALPTSRRKRDDMLALLRQWMSSTSDRIRYTAPRKAAG